MLLRRVLYQMMLLCLLLPLPAMAVSTLSIAPAGTGAFLLSGADLDNLAGIDVTVSYDTTLLTNPRVVQGSVISGAMMAVNSDSAGVVRLAVISGKAIRGTGPVATLTFDRTGDSDGLITSLKGKVVGLNGATLPVLFNVTNPPPPDPQNNPSTQPEGAAVTTVQGRTGSAAATANGAGASIVGGTLSMPAEDTGAAGRKEEPAAPPSPQETPAAREGAASETRELREAKQPAKDPEQAVQQARSVLDRFRLFKGERSAGNLTALFDPADPASFKQDPPIFIADGEGSVRVTIFKVSGDKAPGFAFNSARYVSCRKVSEGEWLVEVQPDKGALSVGITVLSGGSLREIPLTVSPRARVDLINPGKVSAEDFALFLKERGTASTPKFDLNGDGKRDYLDDYIFTANYLVEQEKNRKKETPSSR